MKTGIPREPHFDEIVNSILNEEDNCLDLGANHGSHTKILAEVCSKGRIFAFEPQSLVSQLLNLNIYLNNCPNVVCFNLAVGPNTGEIVNIEQIVSSVENVNSGWSRLKNTPSLHRVITVAIDDLELPRISFIKMDIQGSELDALKGMKKVLTNDRPYIFFEVEEVHLVFRGTDKTELLSELRNNNYLIYRIETEYPSDHLAVPCEKKQYFESLMLAKPIGFPIATLEDN
jgi:FkbM family methyltransferase